MGGYSLDPQEFDYFKQQDQAATPPQPAEPSSFGNILDSVVNTFKTIKGSGVTPDELHKLLDISNIQGDVKKTTEAIPDAFVEGLKRTAASWKAALHLMEQGYEPSDPEVLKYAFDVATNMLPGGIAIKEMVGGAKGVKTPAVEAQAVTDYSRIGDKPKPEVLNNGDQWIVAGPGAIDGKSTTWQSMNFGPGPQGKQWAENHLREISQGGPAQSGQLTTVQKFSDIDQMLKDGLITEQEAKNKKALLVNQDWNKGNVGSEGYVEPKPTEAGPYKVTISPGGKNQNDIVTWYRPNKSEPGGVEKISQHIAKEDKAFMDFANTQTDLANKVEPKPNEAGLYTVAQIKQMQTNKVQANAAPASKPGMYVSAQGNWVVHGPGAVDGSSQLQSVKFTDVTDAKTFSKHFYGDFKAAQDHGIQGDVVNQATDPGHAAIAPPKQPVFEVKEALPTSINPKGFSIYQDGQWTGVTTDTKAKADTIISEYQDMTKKNPGMMKTPSQILTELNISDAAKAAKANKAAAVQEVTKYLHEQMPNKDAWYDKTSFATSRGHTYDQNFGTMLTSIVHDNPEVARVIIQAHKDGIGKIMYHDSPSGVTWAINLKPRDMTTAPKSALEQKFPDATRIDTIPHDEGIPHPGPLIAYHGTGYKFEAKPTAKGRAEMEFAPVEKSADIGWHFGTAEQASHRALGKGPDGSKVIPAYVDIKNPIDMPDLGGWSPETMTKSIYQYVLDKAGTAPGPMKAFELRSAVKLEQAVTKLYQEKGYSYDTTVRPAYEMIRTWLDKHGYDSIRYLNQAEGEGWSYIVWNKGKVKSAPTSEHTLYVAPGFPQMSVRDQGNEGQK